MCGRFSGSSSLSIPRDMLSMITLTGKTYRVCNSCVIVMLALSDWRLAFGFSLAGTEFLEDFYGIW
jgi:hypothetical protein